MGAWQVRFRRVRRAWADLLRGREGRVVSIITIAIAIVMIKMSLVGMGNTVIVGRVVKCEPGRG